MVKPILTVRLFTTKALVCDAGRYAVYFVAAPVSLEDDSKRRR